MTESSYGQELILDVHNVPHLFLRYDIEKFCTDLCELIEMERGDLFFWDYQDDLKGYENAPDHLKGTSAVQFISTSNITIHSLDELKRMYVNVFSCKPFDSSIIMRFVENRTGGNIVNTRDIARI